MGTLIQLPADILRMTAAKLTVDEMLMFCQCSNMLRRNIRDSDEFWQPLMRKYLTDDLNKITAIEHGNRVPLMACAMNGDDEVIIDFLLNDCVQHGFDKFILSSGIFERKFNAEFSRELSSKLLDAKQFDIVRELCKGGVWVPCDLRKAYRGDYLWLVKSVYPKIWAKVSREIASTDDMVIIDEMKKRISNFFDVSKAINLRRDDHDYDPFEEDYPDSDEEYKYEPDGSDIERYLRGKEGPETGPLCEYIYTRGMHKGQTCGLVTGNICLPQENTCLTCSKKKFTRYYSDNLQTKYIRDYVEPPTSQFHKQPPAIPAHLALPAIPGFAPIPPFPGFAPPAFPAIPPFPGFAPPPFPQDDYETNINVQPIPGRDGFFRVVSGNCAGFVIELLSNGIIVARGVEASGAVRELTPVEIVMAKNCGFSIPHV